MATVTTTETFHISGYDSDLSSFKAITNVDNMIDDATSSTNYAQFSLVDGSRAETVVFLTFDTSSIPQNATINSVTAAIKIAGTGSTSYVTNRQIRGYRSASSTIGYSTTFSTSATTYTLDLGSGAWTWNRLDEFMMRCHAQRTTSNTSTTYYIRVYGADLTVNYTYEESSDALYVKQNGVYVQAEPYKKVNGVWTAQSDISQIFTSGVNYKYD